VIVPFFPASGQYIPKAENRVSKNPGTPRWPPILNALTGNGACMCGDDCEKRIPREAGRRWMGKVLISASLG